MTIPQLDGEIRNGRHHMQVRVYYEDTDVSHLMRILAYYEKVNRDFTEAFAASKKMSH